MLRFLIYFNQLAAILSGAAGCEKGLVESFECFINVPQVVGPMRQLLCSPIKDGEHIRKHFTKPLKQPAAPDRMSVCNVIYVFAPSSDDQT